jgi:hypothetical protein
VSFEPSPARRGLDALLARYPHFDVLYVERGSAQGEMYPLVDSISAPWIMVTLGQPSEGEIEAFARWEFAIWKNTGSVYTMADGAVSDDPIIEVS